MVISLILAFSLSWLHPEYLGFKPMGFDCFLLTSDLWVSDVLLFEGKSVMLFKTVLALMELYGTG